MLRNLFASVAVLAFAASASVAQQQQFQPAPTPGQWSYSFDQNGHAQAIFGGNCFFNVSTPCGAGESGVLSFNTRTGNVVLTDTDVYTALGYSHLVSTFNGRFGVVTFQASDVTGVGGVTTSGSPTVGQCAQFSAATVITGVTCGATVTGGSLVVNGVSDPLGTIASSGYDVDASGNYRIWVVIQCEDGGESVNTPASITLSSVDGGATLHHITGIVGTNLSVAAGQNHFSARSTLNVMSFNTTTVVVSNQNSANAGQLTSYYIEIRAN